MAESKHAITVTPSDKGHEIRYEHEDGSRLVASLPHVETEGAQARLHEIFEAVRTAFGGKARGMPRT
jgi:hypothetical protein